jgi:hypothetical protein
LEQDAVPKEKRFLQEMYQGVQQRQQMVLGLNDQLGGVKIMHRDNQQQK